MKDAQISDAWMSSQMMVLGDKCLQALPKEEEMVHEFTEQFQKKMKTFLKRAKLKEKYKIPITVWGRTVASIAVVIIGIFLASLSVEAIRTEIYEFIQQRFETFNRTEYQVIKNEPVEFVPLYPKYIPEGYEMDVCDEDEGYLFLRCVNAEGKGFSIRQIQITDGLAVYEDSEYIAKKTVQVRECEAVLGETDDGSVQVRWKTDSCLYQVEATGLSVAEVLEICNSLEE